MMKTFRAFLMRAMWIKNWQCKSYLRQMPSPQLIIMWIAGTCTFISMCVCVPHMHASKCFAVIKIMLLVVIYDVLAIKFYSAFPNPFLWPSHRSAGVALYLRWRDGSTKRPKTLPGGVTVILSLSSSYTATVQFRPFQTCTYDSDRTESVTLHTHCMDQVSIECCHINVKAAAAQAYINKTYYMCMSS